MSFCTACGRQRTGANRFCTACGTEFPDLAQPEQPATDQDQPDDTFMRPGAFRETTSAYAEPPAAGPLHAEPTHPGSGYGRPGYAAAATTPDLPARRRARGRGSSSWPRRRCSCSAPRAVRTRWWRAMVTGRQRASPPKRRPSPPARRRRHLRHRPPVRPPHRRRAAEPRWRWRPAQPQPGRAQVTALVNSYFTAIDQHDYPAYSSLFDQQMQQQNPESSFDSGDATTTDSAETLTGISDTSSGGLAASVTFTSQQSPADSPDNSPCDRWSITLFLVPDGTGYLIGAPPSSYQASYQAC